MARMVSGTNEAPRYVVERQVIYREPLPEQHYTIGWAIWDREIRRFLAVLFRSREAAERHVLALQTGGTARSTEWTAPRRWRP